MILKYGSWGCLTALYPFIFKGFDGKFWQYVFYNVSCKCKQLPLNIDDMYLDSIDFYGILWWHDMIEKEAKELKKELKK